MGQTLRYFKDTWNVFLFDQTHDRSETCTYIYQKVKKIFKVNLLGIYQTWTKELETLTMTHKRLHVPTNAKIILMDLKLHLIHHNIAFRVYGIPQRTHLNGWPSDIPYRRCRKAAMLSLQTLFSSLGVASKGGRYDCLVSCLQR